MTSVFLLTLDDDCGNLRIDSVFGSATALLYFKVYSCLMHHFSIVFIRNIKISYRHLSCSVSESLGCRFDVHILDCLLESFAVFYNLHFGNQLEIAILNKIVEEPLVGETHVQ